MSMSMISDLESSASDSNSDSDAQPVKNCLSYRRPLLGAFVVASAVLCSFGAYRLSSGAPASSANVSSKVGLQQVITTPHETVGQAPQSGSQGVYDWLPTPEPTRPSKAALDRAAAAPLLPQENTEDNNPCADDEEFHAGLCYDKCAHMTNDAFSFRQSAWTCCSKPSCSLTDFHGVSDLFGSTFGCCRHNMGFCSGFDIAGHKEGKKICPHKPGACLVDEELFLGTCYKKCADLTQNLYPHRVASATCCKVADGTCLFQDGANDGFAGMSLTKPEFNVGGGCGDGSKLTNCKPHGPQEQLTEA